MDYCEHCGGRVIGDGCSIPLHCEFTEVPEDAEADSGPYYCGGTDGLYD